MKRKKTTLDALLDDMDTLIQTLEDDKTDLDTAKSHYKSLVDKTQDAIKEYKQTEKDIIILNEEADTLLNSLEADDAL